jgi:hypothetical protein
MEKLNLTTCSKTSAETWIPPHRSQGVQLAQVPRLPQLLGNCRTGLLIQRACAECAHEDEELHGKIHRGALGIAPKLPISQPDDPFEQEADRVAARVMRMPDPGLDGIAPVHGRVMRAATNGTAARPMPAADPLIPTGDGRPLDSVTRTFFEPRFGADFSQVRLHTDAPAAQAAQAVSARAFTYGNHIYFGAGEYRPATGEGRHLLAHELTHVNQQTGEPRLQRLGANPGCSAGQRDLIRQAIYNARGWLNKAIPALEANPLPAATLARMRRNFGPTYGVAANVPLIVGRLRTVRNEISRIPFGCAGATDATCAKKHCGYAIAAGSHAATICSNVSLTPGTDWRFQAGCVLHESFHAAFTNFTPDLYSGWHSVSTSTPGYPGTKKEPLLNADSYTTLVMELS